VTIIFQIQSPLKLSLVVRFSWHLLLFRNKRGDSTSSLEKVSC